MVLQAMSDEGNNKLSFFLCFFFFASGFRECGYRMESGVGTGTGVMCCIGGGGGGG